MEPAPGKEDTDALVKEHYARLLDHEISDEDFFREIYRLVRFRLAARIISRSSSPVRREDVDDIMGEVFLRFVRAFKELKLDLSTAPLLPWLYVVADRYMIDRWRGKSTATEWLEGQAQNLTPGRNEDKWPLVLTVSRILEELPYKWVQALKLRYLEGHSREETAEIMGVPVTTVDFYISEVKKVFAANEAFAEFLKHGRSTRK